jgi:Fe2+ transport system protein FeoA
MVNVAQLAEQRIVVPRVAGSSPVIHPAAIAQSVERILGKDEVTSSILVGSSGGYMKLSEAKDKEKLEVLNIENNEIEDKLRAMGIYEGCEVCPLMHGNGNMLLDVHGCRYAIDDDLAECIVVRRL